METQSLIVLLHSEQPERLISFYQDVVGLETNFDLTAGAFNVGGATLIVEPHSEVHGPANEPARVMLNFVVADAVSEQARLTGRGVTFTQQAYEEPGVGLFATFLDPDGNLCQLLEFRDS